MIPLYHGLREILTAQSIIAAEGLRVIVVHQGYWACRRYASA